MTRTKQAARRHQLPKHRAAPLSKELLPPHGKRLNDLVFELVAVAYLEGSWNLAAIDQVLTDISTIPPLDENEALVMNFESLDQGLGQYYDRLAEIQRQKDLASVKKALLEAVKKVEECEATADRNVADRQERKRLAHDALDKQINVVDGLRKRLKKDPVKAEEDDVSEAENRQGSQELGTIML